METPILTVSAKLCNIYQNYCMFGNHIQKIILDITEHNIKTALSWHCTILSFWWIHPDDLVEQDDEQHIVDYNNKVSMDNIVICYLCK